MRKIALAAALLIAGLSLSAVSVAAPAAKTGTKATTHHVVKKHHHTHKHHAKKAVKAKTAKKK
ncbi:hypothetical protein [Oleiagrimonas sp. C23AA]|uniref:hypothetical protein n=1 Tax=Oleiagrimonas sp. C23AA TaxID=2719047 RepID=UPI00141FCADC|nr:hypothetical protein [Oleiagrimonas sp. C23AA]NII09325.1 hypothetical protein [Oleiagrimonas sp. C23AA]